MIPKKALVALLCLTLVGAVVYAYFLTDSAETERRAHGFVDVKESALSFERAGKIEYLAVEEGESVEKGQVLARLDTEALSHQLKIRAAQCAGLEADHSRLQKGYREEDKAGAEARLKALESSYALATRTCERMGVLYKRKAVSEQERDDACYGARTLKEEVIAARAERDRYVHGYLDEEIAVAESAYSACLKELAYLEYQRQSESEIVAPYAGVIRVRDHELADRVQAGERVYALSKVSPKEVRVYLSERQLAHVKVGNKARVFTLTATLEGSVASVSDSALFTPKSVQTEELRPDLMYEVRILVPDPEGQLRLGQAVSAEF